jgi:hypothetical protein
MTILPLSSQSLLYTKLQTSPKQPHGEHMPAATISKIDAVRKALAALGKDGTPTRIQEYVKKTFGLEMTMGHISNCKSTLMRKKSKKATGLKAPAAAPVSNNVAAPAKATTGRQVSLQDVQTLKGLVGRVGGGDLKSLIDILG